MRYGNTGVGVQTAGMTFAGTTGPTPFVWTELYDGTSWSETADMTRSVPTSYIGGAGTTTAALAFFGSPGNSKLTETWDGTSWSETNDGNVGRHVNFGIGTQTAALSAGGNAPPLPYQDLTEIWDGTSWTEVNDMNTARGRGGVSGTSTAGLIIAGTNGPAVQTAVESWDGTSWTSVASITTGNYGGVGTPSGTNGVSIYAGGQPSGGTECEEWNDPVYAIKTVTVS